ncbi:Deoxyuridine 5'-triphosphate nucleotidohydrolase [Methylobacterium bullatum]|uniref:dUTP diphosphatase n=1 Tax=Methylobacterium bullatum TaxID=570505 RepID=A0A679ITS2_9HYPH|nr:Deoxyuridine 5'-triphosphate nucleotidohydrolase [Methylobacterium bullatum]
MSGAPPAVPPAVDLRIRDPRLREWGFPRWGSAAAAGLDLHACLDEPVTLAPQAPAILIPAGFSVLIRDPDWCGLVFPRSGLGHRDGLVLGNGTGVIDADYEGPLMISAWNRNADPAATIVVRPGDRIAQLVFTRVTRPAFTIVDALDLDGPGPQSGRGQGGFGSTGRR